MRHFTVSAPGKVLLHGEHSVVYNKLGIASSLNIRTTLDFQEFKDADSIYISLTNININAIYSLKEIIHELFNKMPETDYKHPEKAPHEELLGISLKFLNNEHSQHLIPIIYLMGAFLHDIKDLKPFHLSLYTKLSIGAGMGSSASYCVCLAAGFLEYRLKKKQFDEDDLKIINQWAYQAEKITHGTPSGIDNTICTFGGWLEFSKNQSTTLYKSKGYLKIILIDTKIPRDTKKQVGIVQELNKIFPTITENILNAMDQVSITASELIKNIDKDYDIKASYEKLTKLTTINHNLLNALNVGHKKLDYACQLLSEYGLNGKLTGAGGGGCAFCYVPAHYDETMINDVLKRLEKEDFNAILTNLGSTGVKIELIE